MRTATTTLLVLLAASTLLLPALADPAADARRYVAGSGTPDMGYVCGGDDSLPGPEVGGACDMPLRAPTVTVRVVDDLRADVPFLYFGFSAEGAGHGCGFAGFVASPAVLTPPAECVTLAVFPEVGSLAGTITVGA